MRKRVLPVNYSCMPQMMKNVVAELISVEQEEVRGVKEKADTDDGILADLVIALKGSIKSPTSSPRAARRLRQEKKDTITTARDLLLSSLLSISAVPVSAFPSDEQKTVTVTLKEITKRIRDLRKKIPS